MRHAVYGKKTMHASINARLMSHRTSATLHYRIDEQFKPLRIRSQQISEGHIGKRHFRSHQTLIITGKRTVSIMHGIPLCFAGTPVLPRDSREAALVTSDLRGFFDAKLQRAKNMGAANLHGSAVWHVRGFELLKAYRARVDLYIARTDQTLIESSFYSISRIKMFTGAAWVTMIASRYGQKFSVKAPRRCRSLVPPKRG